jgi:hypothetical protein
MNTAGTDKMQDIATVSASVGGGATAYTTGALAQSEATSFLISYPSLPIILQIVGAGVGIAGLLLGLVRAYQNHQDRKLKREIYEWEKIKHGMATNLQTSQEDTQDHEQN